MDSQFEYQLDLDGGRRAVGASQFSHGPTEAPGAVYAYRPDVAIDGDYLLAGAPHALGLAGADQFFSLTPNSLPGGFAPADVLATVLSYGPGKPGSLGLPVFSCKTGPVLGETDLMGLGHAAVGTVPIIAWCLAPAAVRFDDGLLPVNPLGPIQLPVVSQLGQVGCPWNVSSEPLHTAQSEGLALTIGDCGRGPLAVRRGRLDPQSMTPLSRGSSEQIRKSLGAVTHPGGRRPKELMPAGRRPWPIRGAMS
ncbi:hypothetical protein [Engelhardtia mirabilis]|uniref:Uncharacterized protein n=1 Tax=Engelhardtia mirabilis TaxID=2528011 RepID=A0A518BE29_9BACT|nr:hypothetical protein Pla133_03090 [Planctomycetes bacterium Pla133]QDU99571.1 hypothetical protein Pla86_03090 [Planctomycetes bacterium Pla86]